MSARGISAVWPPRVSCSSRQMVISGFMHWKGLAAACVRQHCCQGCAIVPPFKASKEQLQDGGRCVVTAEQACQCSRQRQA